MFCTTGIKRLADEERTRPADGGETKPTDAKSKGQVDAEGKRPADEAETRPANAEGLVDAEASTDAEDHVLICYIHQY